MSLPAALIIVDNQAGGPSTSEGLGGGIAEQANGSLTLIRRIHANSVDRSREGGYRCWVTMEFPHRHAKKLGCIDQGQVGGEIRM